MGALGAQIHSNLRGGEKPASRAHAKKSRLNFGSPEKFAGHITDMLEDVPS